MMTFFQCGDVLSTTATADTEAGSVFDLATLGYQPGAGVTSTYTSAGSRMALQTAGVHKVANDGNAAFTADDSVEYDPTDGQVKEPDTGDASSIAVGKVFKDCAATDAYVYVLLNNKTAN